MLNGPALLRVLLVVAAAAVLTGVVQRYWSFDNSLPEPPVARPAAPSAPPRRAEPIPAQPVAPPQATATAQAAATPAVPAPPAPAPIAPSAAPEPPPATFEAQVPSAAAPPPARETRQDAAAAAVADPKAADPKAVDLVDLNTASLSELNALKGGGSIGRAIVQHRPYASIDQLLSKRVLSRAIYQRIKDQVRVR